MFSYRHAFHAGNHADTLKHSVLIHILQYFNRKETAYWVVDTHAGAGIYDLSDNWAQTTAEAKDGIYRLWQTPNLPPLLAEYIAHIAQLNQLPEADDDDAANDAAEPINHADHMQKTSSDQPQNPSQQRLPNQAQYDPNELPQIYPGSPWIALHYMRKQDRLRLFELHPTEFEVISHYIREQEGAIRRQVQIMEQDGFVGIKSLLPPPPRRGIILIDPSYEDKKDYRHVFQAIKAGLDRFSTGCYMVWYPLVQRHELQDMLRRLKHLVQDEYQLDYIQAELIVKAIPKDGIGLYGSGLFIINPPYTLAPALEQSLPILTKQLNQDGQSHFSLDIKIR